VQMLHEPNTSTIRGTMHFDNNRSTDSASKRDKQRKPEAAQRRQCCKAQRAHLLCLLSGEHDYCHHDAVRCMSTLTSKAFSSYTTDETALAAADACANVQTKSKRPSASRCLRPLSVCSGSPPRLIAYSDGRVCCSASC